MFRPRLRGDNGWHAMRDGPTPASTALIWVLAGIPIPVAVVEWHFLLRRNFGG
jgi:hypothetical protein